MKSSVKTTMSMLLVSAMVLSMTACGGGSGSSGSSASDSSSTSASTSAPNSSDASVKDFKIFAGTNALSPDNGTKPIVKQMNEAMGVNITWECVSGDLLTERKNLIFGTNDLPDAFMGAQLTDYELITGGTNGALIPLNDYINEKTMPNLMKILEKRPNTLATLTMPDGNIYTLPTISEMGFTYEDGNQYYIGAIPQFTVINQDWLKKLNLKMPETIDQYHDVLTAFKTKDPNGNGKADEVPLSFIYTPTKGGWCAGLGTFFAPFGFTDYNQDHRAVNDGKVIYNATREEYKKAIAYYHNWFKEGLVDVEGFSQDATQYIAKGKNQDIILGSYAWWEIPEVVGADRASMYSYLPILTDADGKSGVNLNEQGTVGRGTFAVSKVCKNPELLLKWVDQMYDPKMSMQAIYGPIGVCFEEKPDEKGVYLNKTPPEGTTPGELKGMNELQGPTAQLNEDFGSLYYMEDRAMQRLDDLKSFWFNDVKNFESYPSVVFTLEETEIINDKLADIKTYTDEMTTGWLLNGGVEEQWDEYVSQLKSLGIDDVVKCWQDAYDRYKKALK